MKLRRPCQHGMYDEHETDGAMGAAIPITCPGGVFLPDDAIVIEKVDGEWPEVVGRDSLEHGPIRYERVRLPIDTLSVRETITCHLNGQ